MKAVILDALTTNPGDLSWDWLYALCDVTVYDRTPPELIAARCADCEILLTNKVPLRKELLVTLPKVQYIGLLSTGFNVVDVDYCKERGIPVCNIPSYSTEAVAQLTFAFILEHCNQVSLHSAAVHGGEWENCPDFCFWKSPLTELNGKAIGIIGYGKIGKAVARIAKAFGMRILVTTNHPREDADVTFTDLDSLLAESDFVTVHTPLTPATTGMVNAAFLAKMKKTAFLVNTSRGPAVDEAALAEALKSGTIAGAGLDVLSAEPPKADNPLLRCPNCFITPHVAWAGFETRERLMAIFRANIEAFLNGTVQNNVWA